MKKLTLPNISLKSLSLDSVKSLSLPANINLQRRDKLAIAVAAAALGIFIVLQLIIFPIVGGRDKIQNRIISKTKALQEIQASRAQYFALSQNSSSMDARLKKRPKTFALFSFIDQLAGKSGIKGNISSMKPSTSNVKNSSYKLSSVEMKLNALTMEQLTTFLHGLEDPKNVVWIKRISISKADKNEGLLNTILKAETFQQ
jgi:general secretion pathway protein M